MNISDKIKKDKEDAMIEGSVYAYPMSKEEIEKSVQRMNKLHFALSPKMVKYVGDMAWAEYLKDE